jgi:uncharacterized protein (TIGR03000 family)
MTLGQTPYYATSTGHGNYPGSDGFIPGYGYYPGSLPGHYPWLDGPETPFDRRKLMFFYPPAFPVDAGAAAPVQQTLPPGAARVIVKVPAEAEIWFDDAPTSQEGSYRLFTTPSLPADRPLSYKIRARWRIKGAELTRSEDVAVAPGGTFTLNFLTTDGWTGKRLQPPAGIEMAPAPERLPPPARAR